MRDVTLIVRSGGATRKVAVSARRVTIGRGTDADVRIADEHLSRVHASVHREGDRVWVLDERSTSGTAVNGALVGPSGAALRDGDVVELAPGVTATVRIGRATASTAARKARKAASPRARVAIVAVVALVGSASLAAAGFAMLRNVAGASSAPVPPAPAAAITVLPSAPVEPPPPPAASGDVTSAAPALEPARLYRDMTEQERLAFVDREARRVSALVGTRSYAFDDDVVRIVKTYVDGYASRGSSKSTKVWGEGLQGLYGRAAKYAPTIHRAFRGRGLSPVVGLYVTMIESEYRECLTSPAGAKGMFQFMASTAAGYGVSPDQRCDVDVMAPVCARYFSDLVAEFGSDSLSVALAIASYNRGEGGIRNDLHKVVGEKNPERSFWTLVANEEKLPAGFRNENIRYVPKFFAAAIIGENPRAFGLDQRPLSTYTEEGP